MAGDLLLFFFQAEDGIRDLTVTGVQTCALPISGRISLVIVCLLVNQQSGAAFMEQRVWPLAKRCVWVQKRRFAGSIGAHFDIQQVSTVWSFGIVSSVLL